VLENLETLSVEEGLSRICLNHWKVDYHCKLLVISQLEVFLSISSGSPLWIALAPGSVSFWIGKGETGLQSPPKPVGKQNLQLV